MKFEHTFRLSSHLKIALALALALALTLALTLTLTLFCKYFTSFYKYFKVSVRIRLNKTFLVYNLHYILKHERVVV